MNMNEIQEEEYGNFCDKCSRKQYWSEIEQESDPISYDGDDCLNVCEECKQ